MISPSLVTGWDLGNCQVVWASVWESERLRGERREKRGETHTEINSCGEKAGGNGGGLCRKRRQGKVRDRQREKRETGERKKEK